MDHFEACDPIDRDAGLLERGRKLSVVSDSFVTITLASHQISIPLVRSINIGNSSVQSIDTARMELSASPAFLGAQTWAIDRKLAGGGPMLADRCVDLDKAHPPGLSEDDDGDVSLCKSRSNTASLKRPL